MSKTKTFNPDQAKLNKYQVQYEALLANREKFENEIEKIDEQLVNLDEKIEALQGKLRGTISLNWNSVLLIVLILLLGWWILFGSQQARPVPAATGYDTSFFRELPTGFNFRSQQPTADQLEAFLAANPDIQIVLRLNGEAPDRERGALTHDQEAAICDKYGVRFVYLNIDANKPGTEGYQATLATAQELLQQGRVLSHCRNDMHRNGVIVGRYLRSEGFTDQQIIDFNNWHQLAYQPGKYARYVNAVIN